MVAVTDAEALEAAAPLPPRSLAVRVGVPDPTGDALGSYRAVGRDSRQILLELLGPDWSFEGKKVLDFGSGPGKVMRHFLAEARQCELWGCDIDQPSIDWLEQHLSPPLHAFVNGERPPLDQPDGTFDLVWSVSVFTHLTDHWAEWVAEIHRVLADGGLFIATHLGGAMYEHWTGESWDEDRIGMTVLDHGQDWAHGGPTVFHSPWWLREHWGRAFEIVQLREGRAPGEHGIAVLRRRPGSVTAEELERIDPGEPRELAALRHHVRMLHAQSTRLRSERDALVTAEARRVPRRVTNRARQALRDVRGR